MTVSVQPALKRKLFRRIVTGAIVALTVPLISLTLGKSFAETIPQSEAEEAVADIAPPNQILAYNFPSAGCASAAGASGCAGGGYVPFVNAYDENPLVSAGAAVFFNFRIAGPPNVVVPLLISGYANGTNGEYSASIYVGLYGFPDSYVNVFQFGPSSTQGSFTVDSGAVAPDVMQMIVEAVCAYPLPSTNCAVHLDPMIEVDPSFAEASQYTLTESPLPATPEPATSTLLATGLLGLILVGRRQGILLHRFRQK